MPLAVRSRPVWLPRAALQTVLAATLAAGIAGTDRLLAATVAVAVCALITLLFLRREPFRVTRADHVTHVRVVLLAVVAGGLSGSASPVVVAALVVVSVVLDGVDGRVARHDDEASEAGGRFDIGVDSALAAVLALGVVPEVGWWVLVIGALPYLFGLAGRLLPALRRPLPPRYSRKVIGVLPPLVLAAAPLLPAPGGVVATALVLVLLLGSFGRDVVLLSRGQGNH